MAGELVTALADRDREWSALTGAIAALGEGEGGVVLVEGEPGAGRSRLLAETVAAAGERGVAACSARADELTQWTPLAPLADALGATVWALARPDDTPMRLSARLLGEIEDRARRAPQLIALDDVQWADPMTLAALQSFAAHLRGTPVTWVLARRDGPEQGRTGAAAARLFDRLAGAGARRLRLAPLPEAAAAELVTGVLGAPPGAELTASIAEAGGNPALLVALAEGIRDAGGRWDPGTERLPARLRKAVGERLAAYSADTVGVLEVAAVLGHTFHAADVAELLGRTAADIARAVREVVGSGVLTGAGDGELSFRCGLLRRAISEAIPASVRTALHRQAGLLLLGRGTGARSAAVDHLLSGALPGDTQAVRALATAAARVIDTEPATAATIAAKALELTSADDAEVPGLAATRADALLRSGAFADVAEAVTAAAGPRRRTIAASLRMLTGRGTDTAAELEPDGDPESQAVRLAALAGTATGASLAGELAGRDDAAGAVARLLLAERAWCAGEIAESLRLTRSAAACPVPELALVPLPHPALVLAERLAQLGEAEQAEAVLADIAARVEQAAHVPLGVAVRVTRARLALWAGRLTDAAAEAGAAVDSAAGVVRFLPGAHAVRGEVALRRGELGDAEQHIERYRDLPGHDPATRTWLDLQLASARLEPAEVVARYGRARPGPPLLLNPVAAGWLARTAVAAGELTLAGLAASGAADLAARNPGFAALAAAAAHAAGVSLRDPGRLREAVASHGHRWARASAAEDLAGVLAREGRPSAEVVSELDTALETYQSTGALRDVARVRSRLRAAGVRRRHWTYAERPVSGWASLTDTERDVAELVAQGLTNRQVAARMFVSPHTVHAHLGRIFRKLAVNSRVELTGLRYQVA